MSAYEIFVTPRAWREMTDLPGHMRQRVRQAVAALASTPRPSDSKALELPSEEQVVDLPIYELRRLRIDRWRIVYAVTDEECTIDILTVRKRPPYDYGDLGELIKGI